MKKLLVVVDYQTEFVIGVYGFERAQRLEQHICQKIDDYQRAGQTVAFTFDDYYKDEDYTLSPNRLLKGQRGFELFGRVRQLFQPDIHPHFHKETYGSFSLGKYAQNQQFDAIELVGISTHMCVLANAIVLQSALPQCKITLDPEGIASPDFTLERQALSLLDRLNIRCS